MPRQFTEDEVIERIEDMRRRRPRFIDKHITMSHGAGGKASRQLCDDPNVPRQHLPTRAALARPACAASRTRCFVSPLMSGWSASAREMVPVESPICFAMSFSVRGTRYFGPRRKKSR